ncbi:MAG: hypothetical protein VKP62_13965, partial [Candidatus Sericytochromatia bacterium]|nr:hypothetical protein [Candidatus Sericytochromatia bacterium]
MNGALTSGMRGLTCLLLPVLALGCALPNPTQGEKESNADSPSYGLSAMAAPREPHARWLQRLALSDGQLRRLRNIVHDALGMTEPMLDQVRPLLSAAVVDEGQLQAALARVMRQDAVQDAMTLEQIRLTLTPAQRLQVAHGISHFAGSHRMVFERMLDRFAAETGSSLDLSVAQRE